MTVECLKLLSMRIFVNLPSEFGRILIYDYHLHFRYVTLF